MPDETDEFGGRTAVASYVATLSADLAAMARRTGLDTLGYLLEMSGLRPKAARAIAAGRTAGVLEHDLFRKPVPIPDLVEDKLFGIML
jgi:hypothetical protein